MRTRWVWGLVILSLLLAPLGTALAAKAEVQYLGLEALKGMLDDPQVMVIDVRVPSSWADSDKKIKGALRGDPARAATWGKTMPRDKKIVLYCS
jgi:3-mercaptopyruvate sulfurtransferase SseA